MNLIRMILILGLFALFSAGCADDNPPSVSPLLGTWSGTDSDNIGLVCTFKEGGVISAVNVDGNISASYTISGNAFSGVFSNDPDNTFNGTISGDAIQITDSRGVTATLTRE